MRFARAEGLEACCRLCREAEGCRFFSYVARDKACEMLRVPEGNVASNGVGDAVGTVTNDH